MPQADLSAAPIDDAYGASPHDASDAQDAHWQPPRWRDALARLAANRLAVAGVVIIALAVFVSLAAPWLAPYDPNHAEPAARLAGVGTPGHWLGLDAQGRDMTSRLLWGGRTSLAIVVVSVLGACVASLALGLYAGYSRGLAAIAVMRATDLLFAFPMILLAINLATAFGAGPFTAGVTVLFSALPYLTRVVYANVRAEREREYVEAARALGASTFDIVAREILPNVLTPLVVYGTTLCGGMIVFLAGLSYLGLGVQPPMPDWGRMVSEGAKVMLTGGAHVATLPALAIVAVSVAFNWLGDGLRDALDPQG
ncbi:ABC transporter permease [Paraburkholderia unamae]|uniref:Peptide/nickel transport system permease protein n=1 Tax=Paraburkholderia unamae TaxID=219649 RepID=A0ABX5KJ96_9BURK|nr:ABC transporter permease [Paraburkholderia unamae]PVX81698.1 peptide/nickel transport system permease protein [Paraburkholderia unamae]